MVAFIFQVKTDPNQAIKQACLRKKLYYKTFDPIPKNENAESAESFIKFSVKLPAFPVMFTD